MTSPGSRCDAIERLYKDTSLSNSALLAAFGKVLGRAVTWRDIENKSLILDDARRERLGDVHEKHTAGPADWPSCVHCGRLTAPRRLMALAKGEAPKYCGPCQGSIRSRYTPW